MLRLVYSTAARVQELVNLKIENVRGLTCPRGVLALPPCCKGGCPRQIPLCSEAQQAIEEAFDFLARRGFSTHGAARLQDRHHRPLPAREVQRRLSFFRGGPGSMGPPPLTRRHRFAARLSAEKVPFAPAAPPGASQARDHGEFSDSGSEALAQAVQKPEPLTLGVGRALLGPDLNHRPFW